MKYKAKGTGTEANEIERGGVRNEWKGGRRGRGEGEESRKGDTTKGSRLQSLGRAPTKNQEDQYPKHFPVLYSLCPNFEYRDLRLYTFFSFFFEGRRGKWSIYFRHLARFGISMTRDTRSCTDFFSHSSWHPANVNL